MACRPSVRHGLLVFLLAMTACSAAPDGEPTPGGEKITRPKPQPTTTTDKKTAGSDTTQEPAPTGVAQGKNGLGFLAIEGDRLARLELWLDAGPGRDPQTKPGLALLAARSLRHAPTEGGSTVGDRLAAIGGSLKLQPEGRYMRFTASAPPEHVVELATVLLRLVARGAPGAGVVAEQRRRMLAEMTARRDQRLRQNELERLLGEAPNSARSQELLLGQIGSTDVRLFLGLHYRANHALLAIALPGRSAETVDRVVAVFDEWPKGRALAPLRSRVPVSPLLFAEAPEKGGSVTAIVRSPATDRTGDVAGEAAWQRLTRPGGRLAERLQRAGLADIVPRIEEVPTLRERVRTISIAVADDKLEAAVTAIQQSFADLATQDPDTNELREIQDTLMFRWDLRMDDPAQRLTTLARAALSGHPISIENSLAARIDKLEPDDLTDAARTSLVPAVLVRGPLRAKPLKASDLPALTGDVEPVREQATIQPLRLSDGERAELAATTFARTFEQLGSKAVLAKVGNFGWTARGTYIGAVGFTDKWKVRLPNGPATRARRILGTVIESKQDGKDGAIVETIGGQQRKLDGGEADLFALESILHPTVLLARHLAGTTKLSLVAFMNQHSRRLLVFECKLRDRKVQLFVDENTGLPRRIVYLEWRWRAPPRSVELELQDYRFAGALRQPHWIRRLLDGEYHGTLTLSYPK